jgi:virginiamycin B lyase
MVSEKPTTLRTLRRFVLLGLAGLLILVLTGGTIWFIARQPGHVTEFPLLSPHSYPSGIAAGPDGNLWFTEGSGKIGRITSGR